MRPVARQVLDRQIEALAAMGCERVFGDRSSGFAAAAAPSARARVRVSAGGARSAMQQGGKSSYA
jgi:hypothetical protein